MSITSFSFFIAFVISLVIYYSVPRKIQWCALIVFSIYFFMESAVWLTGIYLLVNIFVSWAVALLITKEKETGLEKNARNYMLAGIFINISMLVVLKYSNFFIYNWNMLVGFTKTNNYFNVVSFLTPIGISYYTLTSVGYLVDVYWGIAEAEKNPFKIALFIGYFPQMVSGPVTRFKEVSGQLFCGYKFEYDQVTSGMQRMLWGVFKKLVISTRASVIVDTIYGNPGTYPGLYVWVAATLFMLQLYTDFSGCMDIVLGVSECYGIRLPENFRTPFFSGSVQEFWQRWHITLGAWLKDYVLFPILRTGLWKKWTKWLKAHMGKNISKQLPTYGGMLCVWILIGIWHGGAWKYILGMGIWYWACIVLGQVLEPIFLKIAIFFEIDRRNFGYRFFQSICVFFLIAIGDMFFRLDGITGTVDEIKVGFSIFNPWIFFDKSFVNMGLSYRDWNILIFGILLLFIAGIIQEKYGEVRKWIKGQFLPFRWLIWIFLFLFIVINGTYGPGYSAAEFIYRGF